MAENNEADKDGASTGVVLERIVSQLTAYVPPDCLREIGATVRFDNGMPCCTSTYNHSMSSEDKSYLARRIAASLNFTKSMSLDEIEFKSG